MDTKKKPEDIIDEIKDFSSRVGTVTYLIGGYIRDRKLRRKSKDIDIVMESDALKFAEKFAREYKYPRPVFYGRFGTAMIEAGNVKIEFATARKESYPEDSRKPFIERATIYEDCLRRDFTINAIAENLITGEILDYFDGLNDIRKKILRTPVSPDITFYDDPLRIMRGIRFAARFKFTIDEDTKEAMKRNVFRISIVSRERVSDEILKTMEASVPSTGIRIMEEIGLLKIILPEVAALKEKGTKHPCKELFQHTLQTLDNISLHTKNVYLRLAILLHDIGKPATLRVQKGKVSFHRHEFVGEKKAYKVCRELMIGEEKTKFIAKMIRYHLRPHLLAKEEPNDSALRRFIRDLGKDIRPLFILARADITSKNGKKVKAAIDKLDLLEKRVTEINRKDRISTFKLAVDGHAIMDILGVAQGKDVGVVKKALEDLVVEGELPNRKRALIKFLRDNSVKEVLHKAGKKLE